MEDTLVPIVLFLTIGGTLALVFYLRHRRLMAMIQHGVDPHTFSDPPRRSGRSRLEGALVTIAIGLALTIAFWGMGPVSLVGLIPLFTGLARLLAILLTDKVDGPTDVGGNANG